VVIYGGIVLRKTNKGTIMTGGAFLVFAPAILGLQGLQEKGLQSTHTTASLLIISNQ
jgi:hypothetical protein